MTFDFARLAYLLLLVFAIGGFLVVEFRRDAGGTSRGVLAWVLIFLGLIGAAGLWDDISRSVIPRQEMVGTGRIEVPIGPDGHFHLTAEVNGTAVRFVVDTGASSIALSQKDAEKIGIDLDSLAFVGRAQTANGMVPTATVRLDSVKIGDIADDNVAAVVIRGDIDQSLLGMDYLRRFARVGFESDRLVLER